MGQGEKSPEKTKKVNLEAVRKNPHKVIEKVVFAS
jgi:hypothetical protein